MKNLTIIILLSAGFFLGCMTSMAIILAGGELNTTETYYRVHAAKQEIQVCRTKCQKFNGVKH